MQKRQKRNNTNTRKAERGDNSYSISKSDLDNAPLQYVELEDYRTEDDRPKRLYFRPCPTALRLPLEDAGTDRGKKWDLMLQALAWCTVDPQTCQPLMTAEEWNWKDIKLQRFAISAVLDISFDTGDDDDLEEALERIEQEGKEAEEFANDPNPFVETTGIDLPIASTES